MKEKYCKQEDLKEELEGFATQELAKVKHMVGLILAFFDTLYTGNYELAV